MNSNLVIVGGGIFGLETALRILKKTWHTDNFDFARMAIVYVCNAPSPADTSSLAIG